MSGLYRQKCTVYTDHQALKSLLNTSQPSGKLARWGMALQELELTIVHRSGKCNSNADALSRCPLLHSEDPVSTCELVAALTAGDGTERHSIGDGDLKDRQWADEGPAPVY